MRAPRVTGPAVHAALERLGWYDHHRVGSHQQMKHPNRTGKVTVPMHAGQILPPKTLAAICAQAGIDYDELREVL